MQMKKEGERENEQGQGQYKIGGGIKILLKQKPRFCKNKNKQSLFPSPDHT